MSTQAPQLRGRPQAEIPGRHRRHAGMRPRGLFRQPARARIGAARDHAARDRDPGPQPAMARRRRHHAGGGARGGQRRARSRTPRAPSASPASRRERVIREGENAEEILKLIEEDEDIAILVLAAGTGKEGPGPLVASLGKTAGDIPDPGRHRARAISATRTSTRCPDTGGFRWRHLGPALELAAAQTPSIIMTSRGSPREALNPCAAEGASHVHPDRADAQSGDPEVPARAGRACRAARSTCATRTRPRNRRWPSGCSTSTASPACSSAPTSSPSPRATGEWQQLKPAILGAIMEHFMSGAPLAERPETAPHGRQRGVLRGRRMPRPSPPSRTDRDARAPGGRQ